MISHMDITRSGKKWIMTNMNSVLALHDSSLNTIATILENINTSGLDTITADIETINESQTDKKYYGLNYNSVFTYGIQAIKELDEQLNLEKEKTKLLQEELQKTNQELINAKLDIEKSKFEIQYIKNILEIV